MQTILKDLIPAIQHILQGPVELIQSCIVDSS